ncbi:methionyl-tRNA formyltransferase [Rubrobacter aplysinae]|uniref:methionyl-tRNA formyltransferase n=1 Tax=Rubrobacter aplysinae TaxID=909625 RepID=UPI00064BDFD1|nr:methionyl-tRNA formyltransferase [Rubrobacter aplysinae]
MRIAFAGTPTFAATVLEGLLASEHEVGLVISQPDSRRGRGRKTTPTPVAELAARSGCELRQPGRIGEAAGEIGDYDSLVVAAYGQILRADTLGASPRGAWNVHASLLPAYRGAAPVERAIMAGEDTTGVTIMRMTEGLDTGPFILRREIGLGPQTTGGELTAALAGLGAEAIVEALDLVEAGSAEPEEQDESRASHAAKISPEERFVDWRLDARRVHDHIRALSPHIGARATHPDVEGPVKLLGSRVAEAGGLAPGEIFSDKRRILVGCGSDSIEILGLQLPGSKALTAAEFLVGNRLEGGFSV